MRNRPSWSADGYSDIVSAKATRMSRHLRHEDDPSLYAMKNNLSALEMIFGANSTIVGGVGSEVGIAGGDGGGP